MVRTLIRYIVDSVAEGQKYHLKLVFSDGSTYHSTRLGEPDVTIIIRNRAAEWRMALGGMFEFLESYFNGDVDIVGEQGLRKLINIGFRKPYGRFEHPLTFVKRRFLEWRQNNKDLAQAKRNATYHYGLPTEFFHLVLGDTYGYSEGFWKEDTRTLEEAQHNNFDLICHKLQLNPGDKLIEIGPGWGYMSMLAAEKYGADVTSYGLVPSQNEGMRMLMQARNFHDKLALVEKDHRELANEPSSYDRFVSIGVHEHAGRDCNEQWIRSIAIGLRPGGVGLISSTFNMKKRPTNYCTIKHMFPGGHSQSGRDAAPHGKIWPRCENSREPLISLPPHSGAVAEEFRDALGENSCDRSRSLQREIPQGLAVLSGGRCRNLRGTKRDYQLLPHHIREGTFRAGAGPHPLNVYGDATTSPQFQ